MDRREFLAGSITAMAAAGAGRAPGARAAQASTRGPSAERSADRPLNVLMIMTDQQTWRAAGYAGHPMLHTPHLDMLARSGAVFDRAHCTFPVCTPSRCSILTGTWPHTHNCHLNVGVPERDPAKGLAPDTVMTESILFERGYATKHRGKWHAGDQRRHACYQAEDAARHMVPEYPRYLRRVLPAEELRAPASSDSYYGCPLYMTPHMQAVHRRMAEQMPGFEQVTAIGRTSIPPEFNQSTWITDEVVGLLDKYGDRPFMMTCSVHPPHDPYVVPEPYYSLYDPKDIELPPNRHRPSCYDRNFGATWHDLGGEEGVREFLRVYYALTTMIDRNIGELIKKLKDIGQYENTLIVFTSDHGDMVGTHGMITKSVTPALYDETCRVPLIFSCPRLIEPGRRVQTAANGVDIMPTILDYLGVPIPSHVQGRSLRPFIEGSEDLARPAFTQGTHPEAQHVQRSIRTNEWVYHFSYQNWSTAKERFVLNVPIELFNMVEDPGQEKNLAGDAKYRDVMKKLDDELRQHLSDTGDPYLAKLPSLAESLG